MESLSSHKNKLVKTWTTSHSLSTCDPCPYIRPQHHNTMCHDGLITVELMQHHAVILHNCRPNKFLFFLKLSIFRFCIIFMETDKYVCVRWFSHGNHFTVCTLYKITTLHTLQVFKLKYWFAYTLGRLKQNAQQGQTTGSRPGFQEAQRSGF